MGNEVEELLVTIEGARNMLQGMLLDRAIPESARDAMSAKIEELNNIIAEHV